MRIERAFFKLLVLALVLITAAYAVAMVADIARILAQARAGFYDGLGVILAVAISVARFLLALSALYFVPKVIRRLVPEVAGMNRREGDA